MQQIDHLWLLKTWRSGRSLKWVGAQRKRRVDEEGGGRKQHHKELKAARAGANVEEGGWSKRTVVCDWVPCTLQVLVIGYRYSIFKRCQLDFHRAELFEGVFILCSRTEGYHGFIVQRGHLYSTSVSSAVSRELRCCSN